MAASVVAITLPMLSNIRGFCRGDLPVVTKVSYDRQDTGWSLGVLSFGSGGLSCERRRHPAGDLFCGLCAPAAVPSLTFPHLVGLAGLSGGVALSLSGG